MRVFKLTETELAGCSIQHSRLMPLAHLMLLAFMPPHLTLPIHFLSICPAGKLNAPSLGEDGEKKLLWPLRLGLCV